MNLVQVVIRIKSIIKENKLIRKKINTLLMNSIKNHKNSRMILILSEALNKTKIIIMIKIIHRMMNTIKMKTNNIIQNQNILIMLKIIKITSKIRNTMKMRNIVENPRKFPRARLIINPNMLRKRMAIK